MHTTFAIMEEKNELTPVAAMLDFEAKYFKELFKGNTAKEAGYYRCDRAIRAAKAGGITFARAAGILRDFAPIGAYSITEKIETNATSENQSR